jgi:hypothetical protein|nr:MAG: hypothetical protein [Caudoviricetes sp.]
MIGRVPEIKTIYNRLKSSAKKRNIHFDLSLTDLNNLTYPITCPILGIPLKFNRDKLKDNSYSIDRIDSTKGYVIDNIIVISWKANRLKSNATNEELEKISAFYANLE